MYFSDLVRRSTRSLLSAKARTILTALAIAVGTFALTLTLGASNGAQRYVNKIISDNFDPSALLVTKDKDLFGKADTSQPQEYNQSFGNVLSATGQQTQIAQLSDTDITTLKALPGIDQVQTANAVSVQYITRPGLRKYVATIQVLSASRHPELLVGSLSGPLNSGDIIIPEGFLRSLGFETPASAVGKSLTVSVQKQINPASLSAALVSGSFSTTPASDNLQTMYKIVAVSKKPTALLNATELYLYASAPEVTRLTDYTTAGTASYHRYLAVQAVVKDGNDAAKLHAAQAKIKG